MNKEEKKNTILKAASDVLMEVGLHKTTLDDIGKRAGMAKTSLYYYFKDKKDLVNEVTSDQEKRFLEMIAGAVESQDTAEGKMISLAETYCHFISRRTLGVSKEIIFEYGTLYSIFEQDRDYFIFSPSSISSKTYCVKASKGRNSGTSTTSTLPRILSPPP